MLPSFRDLPIKRKLTLVIVAATMVTLLLVFASLLAFQWFNARAVIQRSLRIQAEIIAANATASLTFDDARAAADILGALRAQPHLHHAALYRQDGRLLAHFGRDQDQKEPLPNPVPENFLSQGSQLSLFFPVLLDQKRIGTLHLRFDARALQRELFLPFVYLLIGCGLVAIFAAALFSTSFQGLISKPILRLTRTARSVAEHQDYTVRAEVSGHDELGTLTTAFNQMLSRIQHQDRALRDSEGRYRLLFQSNPMPMFVHDEHSLALLAANDAAIEHYRYPAAELLQLSLRDLLAPGSVLPDPNPVSPDQRPVLTTHHVRHRKRDGTLIDVEIITHLVEFSGRPAALALCHDVTARKRAEAQLAAAFDDLEAKVSERTRELIVAKVAAEAASQAKSRFLATMSHEIRTPLNGVTGVLHLLLRDHPTPQQCRRIEMAQNSARILLCVINDILDFSKVEAGKLELRAAPTRLHATISNTAATFAYKAADKGLRWTLQIHPAVPTLVITDADRLAQVLGNLLANAIKFTDAGAIDLRVLPASEPAAANGSHVVRFEVTDTGPGIRSDQLRRLFLPFSQVDNSSSRRYGGTGLGLGICKHLVELMHGTIGVRSDPGQGSSFWFELPFAIATPLPGSPEPDPGSCTAPPPPDGAPHPVLPHLASKRVLLAEDNDINREIACEVIVAVGCTCILAVNGEEALKAVRSEQLDFVFMDCMMPGTDGYTATRIIRAEETREAIPGRPPRRIPIVAMTANAMSGDREECLAAGMDDYLSKPLHPDDVVAMLHKWLNPQPDRRS